MLRQYSVSAFTERFLLQSWAPEMDPTQGARVEAILERVRSEGDQALVAFNEEFDGVRMSVDSLRVSKNQLDEARQALPEDLREAMEIAIDNLRTFHREEIPPSWHRLRPAGEGLIGQMVRPLDRVGLYVPGGRAAYPSSLLMNVIPAQLAGVKELAVCTPPGPSGTGNPWVLAAASLLGVEEVYLVGGAQAIGAMAFGTERIARVDKIAGPGNSFVAAAKRLVYGQVDIDSIAGPSELLVVCDDSCRVDWVAADLLAQAEHDPEARVYLFTSDEQLLECILRQVEADISSLDRASIIREAFQAHGGAVLVEEAELWDLVNAVAAEHLSLQVKDPWAALGRIRHAGAIFLGPYSAVSFGDYSAGPNHVLPTATTARFASPLGVTDFVKRSNLLYLSAEGARALAAPTDVFARAEGLTAHARAARIRGEVECDG